MLANEMRQVGHTPRLIDRGNMTEAVPDPLANHLGEIGKVMCYVRIAPSADVRHPLRQFPVIQCTERLQIARQHGIDKPIIEVQTLVILRAGTIGENPRPVCREAIAIHIGITDQIKVFFIAQIMLAGACAIVTLFNIAAGGSKAVPMARTRPTKGLPLNLIGRCCSTK